MDSAVLWVVAYAAVFLACLFAGVPVGFALAGTGTLFALLGSLAEILGGSIGVDSAFLRLTVSRVFSQMSNFSLVAVPMFVYMGSILSSSGIGEDLLRIANRLLQSVPGGLALSVIVVGTILAASTGVAAASIIMLGTISIPAMLRHRYHGGLAAGTVCVAGGLGSVIPPSIMLVIMADQMAVSVGDLFMGSLLPGLLLSALYILLLIGIGLFRPDIVPTQSRSDGAPAIGAGEILGGLVAPLVLIVIVLGSIFFGIASPTEAGGMGAFGALVLTMVNRRFSLAVFVDSARSAARTTSVIFMILIGATCFSVVLRGLGGDDIIRELFLSMGRTPETVVLFMLLIVFVLGFLLDWIEISLILLPLSLPVVRELGIDPVWFTVLVALTLQTSMITPPVGFSLFYVRSIVPDEVSTASIYRGIAPFVIIQLLCVLLVFLLPDLVSYLPKLIYAR